MAEKKDKGKRIKIEFTKLGFAFAVLFFLLIVLWSFIAGVWVGTKIEAESEKKVMESTPFIPETPPSLVENETQEVHKEIPPKEESQKSETKINQEEVKKESVKKAQEKKQTRKKLKETEKVEKLAEEIKKSRDIVPPISYYTFQIASFTKKSLALKLKRDAEEKGYYAFIGKVKIHKRYYYRVYVGKFISRKEALKHIQQISKDFGVKKPLIVEVR